jgi:hypothetical protein
MSVLRPLAVAVALLLVLVPAATRAVQVLETGASVSQISGFHKSVEVPPARPLVVPDRLVHDFDPRPTSGERHVWTRSADDVLPSDPFVPDSGGLRAPPASLA